MWGDLRFIVPSAQQCCAELYPAIAMASATLIPATISPDIRDGHLREFGELLEDAFGCDFHIFDGGSGDPLHVARDVPFNHADWQPELIRRRCPFG